MTSCYEQQNKYSVFSLAQGGGKAKGSVQFLEATEDTTLCTRLCCGENRGFTFDLRDVESDAKMFRFGRRYRCCGCAAVPGCAHQVNVYNMINEKDSVKQNKTVSYGGSSSKNQLARVRTPFCGGCIFPTYYLELYDPETNSMVKRGTVSGNSCWYCPCVVCDCCGATFGVHDENGEHVGTIIKPRPSTYKEFWLELKTESDKYKVELANKDVNFNLKLAILASVFQIDFNFFEDKRGIQECHCCDLYLCGYALPICPLGCLFLCCCKKGNEGKGKQMTAGKGSPDHAYMSR